MFKLPVSYQFKLIVYHCGRSLTTGAPKHQHYLVQQLARMIQVVVRKLDSLKKLMYFSHRFSLKAQEIKNLFFEFKLLYKAVNVFNLRQMLL